MAAAVALEMPEVSAWRRIGSSEPPSPPALLEDIGEVFIKGSQRDRVVVVIVLVFYASVAHRAVTRRVVRILRQRGGLATHLSSPCKLVHFSFRGVRFPFGSSGSPEAGDIFVAESAAVPISDAT